MRRSRCTGTFRTSNCERRAGRRQRGPRPARANTPGDQTVSGAGSFGLDGEAFRRGSVGQGSPIWNSAAGAGIKVFLRTSVLESPGPVVIGVYCIVLG
jgi:hypothetical protein